MALSVVSLALTAALPVVNVFLMTAVGAALARKGILDARARQTLSQLVFWVFVPSLTFYNLAGSVNLKDLAVWWILPANMCISIGIGLVVGWITGRLLRVDAWFRNHFMCVIALGNVGNLPLVLTSTICAGATPFHASLGDQCERLGIAYIAFGMWVASTFQYCVAYNLMMPRSDAKPPLPPVQQEQEPPQEGIKASGPWQAPERGGKAGIELAVAVRRSEHLQHGQGVAPAEEQPQASGQEDWQDAQDEGRALLVAVEDGPEASGGPNPQAQGGGSLGAVGARVRRGLRAVPWGSYLNCPTLAAFGGLTVGCTSAVKGLLFGTAPPLGFLTQSLETLAGGMIPTMMLILGASLGKGPGSANLPKRVIVGSVLIRLAVAPALGTGVVVAMQRLGWFHAPDSLFTFTLLLMHATPTAMNLQTVATLVQSGQDEIACLLCWQYLACLISLPLWMSLFVYLVAP